MSKNRRLEISNLLFRRGPHDAKPLLAVLQRLVHSMKRKVAANIKERWRYCYGRKRAGMCNECKHRGGRYTAHERIGGVVRMRLTGIS